MKKTQLLYLEDTYQWVASAQICQIGVDELGRYLILNRTIFYPKEGGQPSDQGIILFLGSQKTLHVVFSIHNDGFIRHYFEGDITFSEWDVLLIVDSELRMRNSTLHTAGHLICAIVTDNIDFLTPVKGYHYEDGPYIEFSGYKSPLTIDFITKLEFEVIKAINEDLSVTVINDFLPSIEGVHQTPSRMQGNRSRRVCIGNFEPIFCGGTHVKRLSEIGIVSIRKIRVKKGNILIGYEVSKPQQPIYSLHLEALKELIP